MNRVWNCVLVYSDRWKRIRLLNTGGGKKKGKHVLDFESLLMQSSGSSIKRQNALCEKVVDVHSDGYRRISERNVFCWCMSFLYCRCNTNKTYTLHHVLGGVILMGEKLCLVFNAESLRIIRLFILYKLYSSGTYPYKPHVLSFWIPANKTTIVAKHTYIMC